MYRHHTTSAMLATAHEHELRRQAHEARMAREANGYDATSSQIRQHLVAMLVAVSVILGALAVI